MERRPVEEVTRLPSTTRSKRYGVDGDWCDRHGVANANRDPIPAIALGTRSTRCWEIFAERKQRGPAAGCEG